MALPKLEFPLERGSVRGRGLGQREPANWSEVIDALLKFLQRVLLLTF
jgi:hypothetical protein